jgi:hypothetical protein
MMGTLSQLSLHHLLVVQPQVCAIQAPYWPVLSGDAFNQRWAALDAELRARQLAATGGVRQSGRVRTPSAKAAAAAVPGRA